MHMFPKALVAAPVAALLALAPIADGPRTPRPK